MKYIVTIPEVHVIKVPVNASNKEEARKKVSEWLAKCDENIPYDDLEYNHTKDVDEWDVMALD